jgi:hypothetical protein
MLQKALQSNQIKDNLFITTGIDIAKLKCYYMIMNQFTDRTPKEIDNMLARSSEARAEDKKDRRLLRLVGGVALTGLSVLGIHHVTAPDRPRVAPQTIVRELDESVSDATKGHFAIVRSSGNIFLFESDILANPPLIQGTNPYDETVAVHTTAPNGKITYVPASTAQMEVIGQEGPAVQDLKIYNEDGLPTLAGTQGGNPEDNPGVLTPRTYGS